MSDISKIKKEIELNDDIEDSLKESVKETFGSMLEFLGKKNFLRWVRRQEISKVARQTIYKCCTEEEDSYLKEHKDVKGYHTSPENTPDGKRRIVLKRNVPEGRHIRSHETWHALANGLGGFSRFFGEGITEYLNQLLNKRGSSAYYKNVKIVDLITSMYGTGIIRDYLMKQGDSYFGKLADQVEGVNLLSEGNLFTSTTMIDLKTMEGYFERYHKAYYNEDAIITEDEGDKSFDKGLNVLMDTYFAYERTQIDKMKLYKDGKIDFERFNQRLARVMQKAVFIGYEEKKFYLQYTDLVEELVENSHLLYGLTDKERLFRKEYIMSTIEEQFDQLINEDVLNEIDQENDPVFQEANEHSEFKLMRHKIKSENFKEAEGTLDERFNYIKYFDFLDVLKNKTGMSDEYFDVMISQISLDMSESPEKFAELTKNVCKKYKETRELGKVLGAKSSLLQSTKPLFSEGTKTAFAIRKDNEYQLLYFDRTTGEIETTLFDDDELDVNINGKKTSLTVDREMGEVFFEKDGEEVTQIFENGFDEVKNEVISELVFDSVLDKSENGKYSEDGSVLYERLVDDYLGIANIMPADIGYDMLEKAARISVEKSFPEEQIDSTKLEDSKLGYKQAKNIMVKSIRRIGSNMGTRRNLTDTNIKTYKRMRARIDDSHKILGALTGKNTERTTISAEQSFEMIDSVIGRSKEKTSISDIINTVNYIEKNERNIDLQKEV